MLLVATVACGLAAASASARSGTVISFRTPSGNISCAYSSGFGPTFLRCDIRSHLRPVPRPRTCVEGVYGESVGMTRTGAAHVLCISDTT